MFWTVLSAMLSPVVVVIVPPELLLVLPPSPVMVKLPLVRVRMMPLVLLPLADTLVSEMASGVVLLLRVISTAGWPLAAGEPAVLIVPLVTVMVLLLSTAKRPR